MFRPKSTCDLLAGFQVGAGASGPRNPPVGGGETLLFTQPLEATGGSTLASGSYLRQLVVFDQGDVPTGSKVEARKADGTTVFAKQQFSYRRRYDDGSLRSAVFEVKTEDALTSGSSTSIKFYKVTGSFDDSSSLSLATLVSAHPYNIRAVVGGTTYTCNLSDNTGSALLLMSGPVSRTWRCTGVLQNGGTPQGVLNAWFYVTAFEDGSTYNVFGKLINGYLENSASVSITSCEMRDNTTVLVNFGAGTLGPWSGIALGDADAGTPSPWEACWSGTRPSYYLAPVLSQWEAGMLIPRPLLTSAGIITAIGAAPGEVSYAPYDGSNFFGGSPQNSTGAANWIGNFFDSDGKALVVLSNAWHRVAMSYHLYAFCAPVHYYERTGFFIPVVNANSSSYDLGPDRTAAWTNPNFGYTATGLVGLYEQDASHYPAWGKYPFFVTGNPWWHDEMMLHGIGNVLWENPDPTGYRNNEDANVWGYVNWDLNAVRGTAWWTRNIGDAQWVCPDYLGDGTTPFLYRQYMEDMLVDSCFGFMALAQAEQNFTYPDTVTLQPNYGAYTHYTVQSLLMDQFLAQIVGMERLRGTIDNSHAATVHVQKWSLGCAYNPGGGCAYNVTNAKDMGTEVGDSNADHVDIATSWAEGANGAWVGDFTGDFFPVTPSGGAPASGINPLNHGIGNAPYGGGYNCAQFLHGAATIWAKVGMTEGSWLETYLNGETSTATNAQYASAPQWNYQRVT